MTRSAAAPCICARLKNQVSSKGYLDELGGIIDDPRIYFGALARLYSMLKSAMATDGENDRSWQNVISSNLSAAGSEVDLKQISQRFTEEYRKGKSIENTPSDIRNLQRHSRTLPSMLILEKVESASIRPGYASPTKIVEIRATKFQNSP